MANYNSIPQQFSEVQSPLNLDLMGKVMMAKQGQFDKSVAEVDQVLSELKQKENLLIRPEDKARLSGNIQSLLDSINTNGKLDLSSKNLTRSIKSQIGNALDDYTVTQIGNSQKIRSFYTQADELQKKKPELYNSRNFNDALKIAKLDDYLKGTDANGNRVDNIGTLQYNDYVDVANTQDKKAADYAKERGLKDQFLGRSSDAYQTTDKYGVKVTRDEIQQYLESTLDPKTSMQLQIDARATLGEADDATFNNYMQSQTKGSNEALKSQLAATKAYVATHSKEEGDSYKAQILDAQDRIAKNEAKINTGVYNRDEMYSAYTAQTLKNIAGNHDVDIITKIETDHLPYDIMKDERDYALKLRAQEFTESKAARDEKAAATSTQGLGVETEKPTPTPDQTDTNLTLIQRSTHQADDALSSYLKSTNMQGYNNMTPQQQWTFKVNLKPSSPLVKGSTAQLKNLTDSFQDAQGNYSNIVNFATKKVVEIAETTYNDLIGGRDLNAANLGQTMPLTAALLKSKTKFSNLSKEQQLGLTAEFAANNLQYNDALTPNVRASYEKVVAKSKATLKEIGTAKSTQMLRAIQNSTDTEAVGGYLSNLAKDFGGAINNVIGTPLSIIDTEGSYPLDKLIYGEDVANQKYKERQQRTKEMINYSDRANVQFDKMARDYFGGEDTNITELEQRDLRTVDGKPVSDIQQRVISANESIATEVDRMAEHYKANLKTQKAFTFSTEDKAQAKVVVDLKAAILNSGQENVVIPASANYITIDRQGTGYNLTYTTGTADKARRETVYVDKLPKSVENIYDLSAQNWSNSPINPNIKLEPKTIIPLVDPRDRDAKIDNLLENIGLTYQQEIKLKEAPEDTAFATLPEQRDRVIASYPKEFYEKNKQKIEEILRYNYEAVPMVRNGEFYAKINYTENGEVKTKRDPISMGAVKDDFAFELKYYEAIKNLKAERIAALNRL